MIFLGKIHIFETVVSAGSFSKAAAELSCCRKHVAATVEAIERAVGVKLIEKLLSGIRLTPAGQDFHKTCVASQRLFDNFSEKFAYLKDRGEKIRIAAPAGLLSFLVPLLLSGFIKHYPEISLDIRSVEEPFDWRTHAVDFFIGLQDEGMQGAFLMQCRPRLYASPDYIEKNGMIHGESALRKHCFIIYADSRCKLHQAVNWHTTSSQSSPRITMDQEIGFYTMAASGAGVVSWIDPLPQPEAFGLRLISEDIVGPTFNLYAYYGHDSAQKYLVDLLARSLQKQCQSLTSTAL